MKKRAFMIVGLLLHCSFILAAKTVIDISQTLCKDTILKVLSTSIPVSGASINLSANSVSSSSFFRVVLVDADDRRHLLAESYKELADNDSMVKNYAEETDVLNNILPVSLEIYVKDVALNVISVELEVSDSRDQIISTAKRRRLQESKVQGKVDRINAYNRSHDRLWTAGVTELSLLPFEERMRILGFGPSDDTGGFEYYIGGIFEVGERETHQQTQTRDVSFADEYDWTNRHGKNWMTSVKGQGYSNYCEAFAGVACVEALVNLYYNNKIDLDLSEQETAVCCFDGYPRNPYKDGLLSSWVAGYFQREGVCDEASYPFEDDSLDILCRSDQINPQYRVKTSGYWEIPYSKYQYEDSLKKFIINYGPLLSGFYVSNDPGSGNAPRSHAMVLVGYATIHAGDSVRLINSGPNYYSASTLSPYYVVPDDSPLVGRTFFKFKNSNNIRPNDDVDGYMHLLFHDNLYQLASPVRLLYPLDVIDCETGQPMYTDADVVCQDSDGDGYYFWGLGPKPANSSASVPDAPDGDDSDPSVGPMDEYGNLSVLTTEIIISSPTDYSSVMNPSHNIRIIDGGLLRITDTTSLQNNSQIIVESGGELVVDGGVLDNARITFVSGSSLMVKNSGTIKMAAGEAFHAPIGVIVNVESGKIL